MTKQYRIAVIPGDGIGREVVPAALRVLAAAAKRFAFALSTADFDFASCDYYDKHGSMMPADWEAQLRPFDAVFFGAVGDPRRMPDHVSLWGSLLQMRRTFDLYCNVRGTRLIPGVPCPLRDPGKIDMVIVRENTEGEYTEMGGKLFHDTDREMVVQETVMTRQGVDRILEYAFTLAASRPAKHLTSATKSNGIALTMPYWDSRVAAMSARFPDVRVDSMHIDALCAAFVLRPASFDVVVGSNLFGDILSDLAPALTGSLGLAASGNIDPTRRSPSVFEAVHGSALDIAGQNVANPVGQIEAGAMLLRHLGEEAAADAITSAVDAVLGRGDASELTRDLGGKGSTSSLAEAVEKELLRA